MRTSKRALAGVAAGALGVALLPLLGVGTANATLSGTVGPMRVTYTDATQDAVPYAAITWSGTSAATTATLHLTSAPSGAAQLNLDDAQRTGTGPMVFGNAATLAGDSSSINLAAEDDSIAYLAADTAGTYKGYLQTNDGSKKVYFTVTTSGAAASLSVAIDTPLVPKSAPVADLATFTVKSSSGAKTQISVVDSVELATTESGATLASGLDAYDLATGEAVVGITTGSTAGQYTLSGDPQGTPWGSMASGSYTVLDDKYATAISSPTDENQFNVCTGTGASAPGCQAIGGGLYAGTGFVRPGVTSVKFDIVGDVADAGKIVILQVGNPLIPDSAVPTPYNTGVLLDSTGSATLTVPVASGDAVAGNVVVVNGIDLSVGGPMFIAVYGNSVDYAGVSRSPAASTIALKAGTTKNVTFTVDDLYGTGQSGYVVIGTSDAVGASTVSAVTGSNGTATLALPDLSTSLDAEVAWTFEVKQQSTGQEIDNNFGAKAALDLNLVYTETGDVTLSDMMFDNTAVADYTSVPLVPFGGALATPVSDPTGTNSMVETTVTLDVPYTEVDFTGSNGVWFAPCAALPITDIGAAIADGTLTTTATVAGDANAGATATVCVTSTKVGAGTVTATSTSGSTKSGVITFANDSSAARDITLTADPSLQTIGSPSQLTVTVKDVFGNAVALDGAGPSVALTTDVGTFGNGSNVFAVNATDAGGTARVSLNSAVAGLSSVSALATGGQFADEADTPYTGAAASVYQAATTVNWSTSPTSKSIVIVGERTTVSGKPGIHVDGQTTGFATNDTVKPWVKFPGQTEYTVGSARPKVDADGEFQWERKTGKKVYVKFSNDDESVWSARIIIPAA